MSYEYKGLLKSAVRVFLSDTLQQDSETGEYLNLGEVEENYSDISIELDHVYTQAPKADDYEAKAKLMDNIYAELKKRDGEAIDSLDVDYYDFGVYVARTIEEYESECDSNA